MTDRTLARVLGGLTALALVLMLFLVEQVK